MSSNEGPPDERPLECGECKKPIAVKYTEIIGDVITHTVMCTDCPVLQRKLYGDARPFMQTPADGSAGLACGNCETTLDAVRMGAPLGCSICYDVFDEVILGELQSAKKLPARINLQKKSAPIHIGRAPGEMQEVTPAMQLLALNDALSETLKREDYEQAAWLRDQIKALTDERKPGGKNEQPAS